MSIKKRRDFDNVQQNFHAKESQELFLQEPLINNLDDIAIMSDEDLANGFHILIEDRNKVANARQDTRSWDEEICYFRREMHIRRERREFHENWIKSEDDEIKQSQWDEKFLPAADLNNSSYMIWN